MVSSVRIKPLAADASGDVYIFDDAGFILNNTTTNTNVQAGINSASVATMTDALKEIGYTLVGWRIGTTIDIRSDLIAQGLTHQINDGWLTRIPLNSNLNTSTHYFYYDCSIPTTPGIAYSYKISGDFICRNHDLHGSANINPAVRVNTYTSGYLHNKHNPQSAFDEEFSKIGGDLYQYVSPLLYEW